MTTPMRTRITVALLSILIISLAGCQTTPQSTVPSSSTSTNQQAMENIQIGFITALTGSVAPIGKRTLSGSIIALNLHNSNPDRTKNIEFVTEDDQYNPKLTVNAYHYLKQKGVEHFIMTGSGPGMATAPLVEQDGFVMMDSTATTEDYTHAGENSFRVVISSEQEAPLMSDVISELGVTRLAILVHPSDYGMAYLKGLNRTFPGEVVFAEPLDLTSDYRTELIKVKESGADGLFFIDLGPGATKMLNQRFQLPEDVIIVTHQWAMSPEVRVAAGENAEGVYYTGNKIDYANPEYQKFAKLYEAQFGLPPAFDSTLGFDGARVFIEAIENTDGSTEAVTNYLKTNSFEGLTGTIEYDENEDRIEAPIGVYKIQNGQVVEHITG